MNNKNIKFLIYGISFVVFILVILLNKKVIPAPSEFPEIVFQLPKINAFINGICSILLIASGIAIKNGKISLHKKLNLITFGFSAIFLIGYVAYHYLVQETTFGGTGTIRNVYYFILTSHIILAALVFPLVLFSFQKGLNMEVQAHKRIVRWSYPIWLYVTITGVIVYLMISPYYPWNN